MIEHDVECDDVLSAMSHNLVETHALYRVPEVVDRVVVLKTNIKPPREIFYRQTVTFQTKMPPPPAPRRCTCKFLCTGAGATVKCMTCSLYDVSGAGYFCDLCFHHRHPWYRVPHIYTAIEKDESIEHTLSVQHRKVEAIRYEQEGKDILDRVRDTGTQLGVVGDDEDVDKKLFDAGRTSQAMEDRLMEMRYRLRADLRSGEMNKYKHMGLVPMDDKEAAGCIQRVQRGYIARRVVSLLIVEHMVRVYDMKLSRWYFHDQRSGSSTWEKPKFLLTAHFDLLAYVEDHSVVPIWCCKRLAPRRRRNKPLTSVKISARIISGFFLCIRARKRILAKAREVWKKVWDDNYKQYFYANVLTGESAWHRPAIFILEEPPVQVEEQQIDIFLTARDSARGTKTARGRGAQSARGHKSARRPEGGQQRAVNTAR
jgi:hypothetical protein